MEYGMLPQSLSVSNISTYRSNVLMKCYKELCMILLSRTLHDTVILLEILQRYANAISYRPISCVCRHVSKYLSIYSSIYVVICLCFFVCRSVLLYFLSIFSISFFILYFCLSVFLCISFS